MKVYAQGLGLITIAAILIGCSSSQAAPTPRYSDLSKKVSDIVQRTQGDPSKMTPEDQKIIADAKAYKIMTPPGY